VQQAPFFPFRPIKEEKKSAFEEGGEFWFLGAQPMARLKFLGPDLHSDGGALIKAPLKQPKILLNFQA
jgi:hypothetical protein